MTGTPRATASLIAPVTFPASEQDERIALAPSVDGLRDALRLDLTILGWRRQPRDLDRHAVLRRSAPGRRVRPGSRRQEDGVGGLLGDHRNLQRGLAAD